MQDGPPSSPTREAAPLTPLPPPEPTRSEPTGSTTTKTGPEVGAKAASTTVAAGSGLGRQALSLLLWIGLALVLRWAVVEPRWIPSGSMLPTLQLQDRVLVEKLRARFNQPLPIGAIVVFRPPSPLLEAGYDPKAALIKRVVARAGDRVEVRQGVLWRNGQRLETDWASAPMDYDLPAQTVPAGHLLVLGDNRNASLDSHLWGPLPSDHLIGTAIWRYWPLQRFGPIGGPPKAREGQLG